MVSLATMIPRVETVARRATEKRNDKPSEEAMARFSQRLRDNGYTDVNPKVFEAICEYGAAEEEGKNKRGLFIKGVPSIGKTLGVEFIAAFFEFPVFTAKFLETTFLRDRDEFEYLLKGENFFGEPYPAIVIDDIGAENYPLKSYGASYNLISEALLIRYREFGANGSRTIITTNFDDKKLMERYGERIDERDTEMFIYKTVTGKSLRV